VAAWAARYRLGVAQRRHHYERAFERYLRERRIPYISVDEARKALLPDDARLACAPGPGDEAGSAGRALKSFDFVIYSTTGGPCVLAEVKGRRISGARGAGSRGSARGATAELSPGRMESWVTQGDVDSLGAWERLFGAGFVAAFIFLYWCERQPPDALFHEVFEDHGRWYAVRACLLSDYTRLMKVRSRRWGTLDLSRDDFERVYRPFVSGLGDAAAPRGHAVGAGTRDGLGGGNDPSVW
jgi:hypothetical protein